MNRLLKILGILFLIIVILIMIALIGGFIFLKNFDIKKYKPQIIEAAGQSLGRPVNFNDIDLKVSLEKGIRFNLTDFSIAENPDFGSGSFVVVEEIDAGVDILPFLMSRQISVPSVLVRSPRIEIVRNADGSLNIQTIGQPAPKSSQGNKSVSFSAFALPAIFINSFKIENAQIFLTDKSIQPDLKLAVTKASLDVQRFSLTKPFNVSFEAAVLSSQRNLSWAGKAQLKPTINEARILDTDIAIDLNHLPLDQLRAFPLLNGIPFPQVLEGQLKVKIKEAQVSDKGLEKINVDVALSKGRVIAPQIVQGISIEINQIDFGLQNFSLDGSTPAQITLKTSLYQDQPNVDFTGKILLDPKTLEFRLTEGQFTTDLSLWPLKKIKSEVAPLKDVPLPEQLSGKVKVTIKDATASAGGLKSILLDVTLENGKLVLNDVIPGTSLEIGNTDAVIRNFTLDKPFSVSLKTAYLSESQNISFDGIVSCDLADQSAVIKDGLARIDLDSFPLDRVKTSGFVPAGAPFPKVLAGKLNVMIDHFSVSSRGLGLMDIGLQWQDGKIQMDEVAPGISFAANKINLDIINFSFDDAFDITGSLGYESEETNASIDGKVAFDLETQSIQLSEMAIKADLGQIPFDRLKTTIEPLKDIPFPQIFKGQLYVNVKKLSAGPKGLDSVLADVVLNEGEVSMKEIAPGISFAASHINADVKDFGLNKPFGFDIHLAYLSDQPNIDAKGTATFRLEDQRVTLKDTNAQADIGTFSMDNLKASVAAWKDVPLPEKLRGNLNISITQATAGPKGLSALSGNGSLKDWEVKLKELALPVRGTETNFKMTESQFTVDELQAALGKGQISAKVGVADYMTRQNFDFSGELKGLDLAEILDQKDAPVKVEGLVFGNIKAKGETADPNSITGDGNLEVKEAKLKDLNVLKTVLDKISFLPAVSSRIETKLPEKYKQKLKNKDTEIKKITAPMAIAGGATVLDPISVEADEFIFLGKCKAGFDQKYALDGKVKIPMELSLAMGEGIEELKYLYDENSNISLPVHVTGKGPDVPVVAVTQTAIDMGRNVMRNEGKKQLEKALNKVLGVEENTTSSDIQNQPGTPPSQGQKSSGSQIIDGIFDKIFK